MVFGVDDLFYIMAALSAANSIANPPTSDINEQKTGTPTGGSSTPGTGPLNQLPFNPVQNILQTLGYEQQGSLSAPVKGAGEAAKASATAAKPAQAAAPALPGPTGTAKDGAKTPTTVENPPPGPDIGSILAAIPDALAAVDMLFGAGAQDQRTQRAAPVAGMAGGGLVGQFATPFGGGQNNIGALLAQLPGLR